MDINNARQRLLNLFPQRYRQHILDFAQNLTSLDADVLIFTARKSACFFHSLEHLRLWSVGNRIVTTDRLLDHDTTWLRGKRVAVIDEVIVSGTSLYRLKSALFDAGVADVRIYALFINSEWFVEEFFRDNTLTNSYIELPGRDAQSLGTTIVRAFQCLPRPYSIDYPMSGWLTLSEHDVETLASIPEWIFSKVDQQWAHQGHPSNCDELAFFRLEPSIGTHARICSLIGVPVEHVVLLKVRTYGRWEQNRENWTYHFRIVPYVVLGEMSILTVEALFGQVIAELDESGREALSQSCLSGKAKLRVIQYVLSARFARIWSGYCKDIGLRLPFVEDQRELSFVFPASLSGFITTLCNFVHTETGISKPDFHIHTNIQNDDFGDPKPRLSASDFLMLSEIFLSLYLDEEIPERQRAKKEGLAYFHNVETSGRGDRLSRGKTLLEIRDAVTNQGVNITQEELSTYIDLAVDSGIVVPITVKRQKGIVETLTRAYRHGEETYIVQRDLGLFHSMLLTMSEDIEKTLTTNNVRALSYGHNRLGRIMTEKALVLFVRYAIDQGVFPRVYSDTEERNPAAQLIGIGYDMFGARVAVGEHKPTEITSSNTFIGWLQKHGILLRDHSDGYGINPDWRNPYGAPDAAHLTIATRFAAVLSAGVKCLVEIDQEQEAKKSGVTKEIDRTFVTLTTCESEASTLMAIGAELRRFDGELLALGVSSGTNIDSRSLVTADRFVKSVLYAMNSGYLKLAAFIRSEAANNSAKLSSRIQKYDRVYAGLWDDIWRAVRREQSGKARERLVGHLVGAVSALLKGLLLSHYVRLEALKYGKAAGSTIKHTESALKTKLRQLHKLADEAIQSGEIGIHDLGKTIETELVWFDKTTSKVPHQIQEFNVWAIRELAKIRVSARDQYEWIDNVTADDGRIARLKEYDSMLSIRTRLTQEVWQQSYAAECEKLTTALIARFYGGSGGPRAYAQSGRTNASDSGDIYTSGARQRDGRIVMSFLATGKRGVTWLGYVQASIAKLFGARGYSEPIYRSSVALLGLESSRRIFRDFNNGGFTSPSTAKALLQAGHDHNELMNSSCAVLVDSAGKEDFGQIFIKEVSETLRRKVNHFGENEIIAPEAGGTFIINSYFDGGASMKAVSTTDVAWVFIVEDELGAALELLEDNGIEVGTSIRPDGVIVGDAEISHESGRTLVRMFISPAQGNMPIGNMLSNICSTEGRVFKFIVVCGICCSFGDNESLGNVVLPISSLDMQLWKRENEGRTPRSDGQKMPTRSINLIRWYLAMRGRTTDDDIKIIDNAVMVSDNDLLRVDSPSEDHRQLASRYSDKAVVYDMETAGVVNWGHQNPQFPPAVVIKGLSDFGRSSKSDDENRYRAAKNAIKISLDFIRVSSKHG